MLTKQLGMILIMVAACKGGDKDKGGGTAQSGTASGKADGCKTTAAKVADLVTTKTAGPIAPIGALTLGMSRDEVAKACPNFFDEKAAAKKGNFSVNEIVGQFGETYLQSALEFENDKLVEISVSAPPDLEQALTASWGAPKVSSGAKPAQAWFDEAKSVRAVLEPVSYDGRRDLKISSYLPLDAFVETETTRLPWKPQAVLGKQPAELAKTFPQFVKAPASAAVQAKTDELMKDLNKEVEALGVNTKRDANMPDFELPGTPYGTGHTTSTTIHTEDDGSVRSYTLSLRTAELTPEYDWPAQSADVVKLLDTKWGAHKEMKETLGPQMTWFDAKNGVRATARTEKPEELDVNYSQYMPLANLWGAPGALWGFEKAERPLIGSTTDEIKATYGKVGTVKHDEAANTMTLSLPPTDYDGTTARTTILMFVRKGGKIGDWRFNIPFGDYDPARAEYEAALTTKYGKLPAPNKYGEIKAKGGVVIEYSDITHSLEVIVGEK